jgi:hypothetical protein
MNWLPAECVRIAHNEGKSCEKCNPNKEDLKLRQTDTKAASKAEKLGLESRGKPEFKHPRPRGEGPRALAFKGCGLSRPGDRPPQIRAWRPQEASLKARGRVGAHCQVFQVTNGS